MNSGIMFYCFAKVKKRGGTEKGSGTKNAKHPLGRSGFWYLTPFPDSLIPDKALRFFVPRNVRRVTAHDK